MKFLTFISFLWLSACGVLAPENGQSTPSYPFDGVKQLSPAIIDGADTRTMLQTEYSVSAGSHLLLRLENFLSKKSEVSLSSGHTVNVIITLIDAADSGAAVADLQLCPLTKNWMMLATWRKAYPMGRDGAWTANGGDYDAGDCVSASLSGTTTLNFEVTQWFKTYVAGRNTNNGFVLLSTRASEIRVAGDAAGNLSPKLQWFVSQ